MRILTLVILVATLSACSDKNSVKIESAVKSNEASKGYRVKSYEITSQKDSARHWHVVNYQALTDGGKTTSGHLVFGITGDGELTK